MCLHAQIPILLALIQQMEVRGGLAKVRRIEEHPGSKRQPLGVCQKLNQRRSATTRKSVWGGKHVEESPLFPVPPDVPDEVQTRLDRLRQAILGGPQVSLSDCGIPE